MKKMFKFLSISAIILFGSQIVNGQKEVTQFLEMGVNDAKIISKAYLRPYGEMLGSSLNGGWYNSARVHRIGGFSFGVGMNMSMVPSAGKSFDVQPLLNEMQGDYTLSNPNNHIAPTIAGSQSNRPVIQAYGEDSFELELPDGSGFDKMPLPMVQAAVGLPFRTELSARFIPTVSAGDAGKVNLFGFGVKHSIKEYIPVVKRLPTVNTSVQLGYTNLSADVNVAEGFPGSNQKLEVGASGFTSRLLIGVNIPFIAVYTGMGYGTSSSDFDLKGTYEVNDAMLVDPISLGYSTNGFDFNAGMRIRLGVLAIYGDYTLGDYSMVTAGVGLSFR